MISIPVPPTTSVHCPPSDPIKIVPTWLRQSTMEMITGRGPDAMTAGGAGSRVVGHVEPGYAVVERVKVVPTALGSTLFSPLSMKVVCESTSPSLMVAEAPPTWLLYKAEEFMVK